MIMYGINPFENGRSLNFTEVFYSLARLGLEAGALYVASLAVDRAREGGRDLFRTAGYEVVRGHHSPALDRAVWEAAEREAAHRGGAFVPRTSDRSPRLVDPPPPDPSAVAAHLRGARIEREGPALRVRLGPIDELWVESPRWLARSGRAEDTAKALRKFGHAAADPAPGGSTIIDTVLQVIVNVVDFKLNVEEATHQPRIFQDASDKLRVEPNFNPDTVRLLGEMGHPITSDETMGSAQSIMIDGGHYLGAADPRRPGALAVALALGIGADGD